MKTAGSVYLHVSNSGITFEVVEDPEFGPTIEISSNTFGNINTVTRVFTDIASLKALAQLFDIASRRTYGKPCWHPAHTMRGIFTEVTDEDGQPTLKVEYPKSEETQDVGSNDEPKIHKESTKTP